MEKIHNLPTEWDLTQFYADEAAFMEQMKRFEELIPVTETYRGKLGSAEGILKYLEDPAMMEKQAIADRASMYAEALHAKNAADPAAQRVLARLSEVLTKEGIGSSFVDAEIMALPFDVRTEIFSRPELLPYAYACRKYTDPKTVVLNEQAKKTENLFADAVDQSAKTHDIFDYTEVKRPRMTFPDGSEEVVTDTVFTRIMRSREYAHDFKKEVFLARCAMRSPFENTYASLLEGCMKGNWARAQLYGFSTSMEAAFHQTDVNPLVYEKIMESVHRMLPKAHAYYAAKKKAYGLAEMFPSEMTVPVSSFAAGDMTYEEAVNLGRESLGIWGEEYMAAFDRIITNPLVDVYPADGKSTGAFEELAGRELLPMILFNFDGTDKYASTIVHEMGHAVYSLLSAENQDRYNCTPGIFTQEVASTANEIMFRKDRILHAADTEEKIYWLEDEIDLFLGTIHRQCLFSTFEDWCYKKIEGGEPLSAPEMDREYLNICREYYGDAVALPEEFGCDWARIPHMYYNYYVYQYATSITYAAAICSRVSKGEKGAAEDYVKFLKAGNSMSPDRLLAIAGVDPLQDETYRLAEAYLGGLIDEFIKLADAR